MSNSLNSALAFQQVTALATMHPCKKQHAINHWKWIEDSIGSGRPRSQAPLAIVSDQLISTPHSTRCAQLIPTCSSYWHTSYGLCYYNSACTVSAAFSDHFATHHHPNCSNSGFQRHFWLNQWHTCCLVCSMSNSCRTLAFCTWKSHNTANTGKYGDGRLINSLDYYIFLFLHSLIHTFSHVCRQTPVTHFLLL